MYVRIAANMFFLFEGIAGRASTSLLTLSCMYMALIIIQAILLFLTCMILIELRLYEVFRVTNGPQGRYVSSINNEVGCHCFPQGRLGVNFFYRYFTSQCQVTKLNLVVIG